MADPLDDNTAERLVSGRLGADDAPPGYAGVARVLQAAAGPPGPGELAGRDAALAMYRVHGPASGRGRPGPRPRPRGRARGRLVALALAGVVAAGGLWMTDGARTVPGLRSPTGGPGAGRAGSGTPGPGGPGPGAPGLVNQARPTTPPVTGTGTTGRAAGAGEPSTTRPGGIGAGGGPAHGAKPNRPGKPPKPKPKPKPNAKPDPKPDGKPKHQR